MLGKPGLSSFDKFAMGNAIRSELLTKAGGNLIGLNSAIMKLANGDSSPFGGTPDPEIAARAVTNNRVASRKIGKTVSSLVGGLGPMSTPARSANLLGNPYMRRYEEPNSNGTFMFGLPGSPMIGDYYDVYESEANHVRFLDDTAGRDLFGYTHYPQAAVERSESKDNDLVYLRGTYAIFEDTNFPLSRQDIVRNTFGPKRYTPTDPYVLVGLEGPIVRTTMNGKTQEYDANFDAFLPDRPPYTGSLLNMWDYMGSHVYLNILNGVMEHGLYAENYQYEKKDRTMVYDRGSIPQSDYPYFLDVKDTEAYVQGGVDGAIDWDNSGMRYIPEREVKGLINKTNRMFYEGKIRSLVNRFATLNGNNEGAADFLNTATDHIYGLSRGRNLRKLDLTYESGYPNPYCRVWTTHYQYSKYKHLIRGKWDSKNWNSGESHVTLHGQDQLMRPNEGYERFKSMSSLNSENGRPIYAPFYKTDRGLFEKDSIKRCMFSIENLAWKDIIKDTTLIHLDKSAEMTTVENTGGTEYYRDSAGRMFVGKDWKKTTTTRTGVAKGYGMTLTPEQRGPNGGRIMWFPPYNLKFSEDLAAEWNEHDFIGRGEPAFSYVKSRRRGSLDFTILVDHPSIVNEWARGGKKGKTGGKASPLSKDEMILRYFAGCDSLEFDPRKEYPVPYTITDTEQTTLTRHEVKEEKEIRKKEQKPSPAPTEEPKLESDNGGAFTIYTVFFYPNNYSGQDFIDTKWRNETTNPLRPNIPDAPDPVAAIEEMFEIGNRNDGTKGYELNRKNYVIDNNDAATTPGSGMTYEGVDGRTDKWYVSSPNKTKKKNREKGAINYWYYPVDSRVSDEMLPGPRNYRDMSDYGLNRTFFGNGNSGGECYWEKIPDEDEIVAYLNSGNTYLTGTTNDFTKTNLNIVKDKLSLGEIEDKSFVPSFYFFQKLNEVITKLNAATKNQYKFSISISGYASSHGYVESNKILAKNRAETIKKWIEKLGCFDFEANDRIIGNGMLLYSDGQIEKTGQSAMERAADRRSNPRAPLKDDESDFTPKCARAAVVELQILIKNDAAMEQVENTEEVETIEKVQVSRIQDDGVTTERTHTEDYDTSESTKPENQTYDDEYAYFKMINENDDMVKRYISDKVDYFNPAFHSITPEGFNARLTFLNQCTRQGPTLSTSDLGGGSSYGAGNLAFGRPPICVLRIGDFYNTKIVIDSIGITYDNDGISWDLNPEGIGLQPMLANVRISFSFIGGSDLSGPISRLQNAVSYNYYANTSVYDRRADYRKGFIEDGKDETEKAMTWSPLMVKDNMDINVTQPVEFSTRIKRNVLDDGKNKQ